MHLWAFVQRRAAVAEQTKTLLPPQIYSIFTPTPQPSAQTRRFWPGLRSSDATCSRTTSSSPSAGPPSTATGGAAGRLRPKRRQAAVSRGPAAPRPEEQTPARTPFAVAPQSAEKYRGMSWSAQDEDYCSARQ